MRKQFNSFVLLGTDSELHGVFSEGNKVLLVVPYEQWATYDGGYDTENVSPVLVDSADVMLSLKRASLFD